LPKVEHVMDEVVTYKCCEGWEQSLDGTGCTQRESYLH